MPKVLGNDYDSNQYEAYNENDDFKRGMKSIFQSSFVSSGNVESNIKK